MQLMQYSTSPPSQTMSLEKPLQIPSVPARLYILDAPGRQQGCPEGAEGRIWLIRTMMRDRRETPLSLRMHRELGTGKGCFVLGKSDTGWGAQ